ncbi:MAG: TlyA family RNA methyltransferase [Hyphomicrobiaceae bacterium]|nr:TlyA family RNA methyltransferase [Hyphomicrobiaceae bacterium]
MRQRLDHVLVSRGLVQSRSRAADLIARGAVRVDSVAADKPGLLVAADCAIEIDAAANAHVARSGVKLVAGLDAFAYRPAGRVCLDVGASTGGFTQVLLERGAARVYAVDVGRGQLHARLVGDARVVDLSATDARSLDAMLIPEPVWAVVADVSFVSLTQVLGPPLALTASGAFLVALVKPQFEAGREVVAKRGVVRDALAGERAVDKVAHFLVAQGWRIDGVVRSPLPGKEGNIEWLIGARRSE